MTILMTIRNAVRIGRAAERWLLLAFILPLCLLTLCPGLALAQYGSVQPPPPSGISQVAVATGRPGGGAPEGVDDAHPFPVKCFSPSLVAESCGGSGGGGGTEYTEDAASAANPVGGVGLCIRRDSLSASEVSADGDNVAFKCTSKGQVHVFVDASLVASLATAAKQDAEAALLGEVQASPTANTVLDRLKTIGTNTGAIDGKLILPVAGTATTSFALPTSTQYAANEAMSDSTSAPTSGGFTFSSVCSAAGKSGIITSLLVTSSVDPATPLQGELWLFDSSVTALNDNAAFAMSDSDVLKLIPGGVIPFTLATTVAGSGTNSYYAVSGLNIGYTCSGTANLRFLVKVKNTYTPATDTLQFRANYIQSN